MKQGIKNLTDREIIFDENIDSPYLWCLHCERVYIIGEYRTIKMGEMYLEMCPYEDCNGDTIGDGWPWTRIREINPQYPVIPEKDTFYPMYPKK